MEGYPAPLAINALENVIALCPTCHRKYDKDFQAAEMVKLRSIKDEFLAVAKANATVAEHTIQERVFEILDRITALSSDELDLPPPSSYQFTSPEDTGTGKSFAGLVGFDLAMLSLTKLPLILHDSIIYKNIEVPATRRILRILAALKSKQIFLSFDEAKKFGSEAEDLLKRFTVVKLAHDDLLYTKDWRTKK